MRKEPTHLRARNIALIPAAIILAVASLPHLAGTALAQSKPDIRIGTGRQGGAYYRMGAIIADAMVRSGLVKSATAESVSGAIESARLAEKGTLQVFGMDKTWVVRAANGEAPFKKKLDLRTVMPMGAWSLFFVTQQDSPIKTLEDLKGKRIAVGARGSGMEQHARMLLKGLGMTFKDITPVYLAFGPGARAVKDGKADAQLQCCLPNGSITELSELSKVRAVNMDKNIDKLIASSGTYGRMVMEKGVFKGHDKDMAAISILQGWMGTAKLDDEVAYIFAKTLISNLDAMSKKMPQFASIKPMMAEAKSKNSAAPVEIGAPLHPGTTRAFKEAGILK
ncbi:MAG: TAXI family TRAP transporter solute-binding subunit [Beijerinckiaceae bacterium]